MQKGTLNYCTALQYNFSTGLALWLSLQTWFCRLSQSLILPQHQRLRQTTYGISLHFFESCTIPLSPGFESAKPWQSLIRKNIRMLSGRRKLRMNWQGQQFFRGREDLSNEGISGFWSLIQVEQTGYLIKVTKGKWSQSRVSWSFVGSRCYVAVLQWLWDLANLKDSWNWNCHTLVD